MRILYTANVRIPTEKAHGVQIIHTCAALAERGHSVTLLVPNRYTFNANPFKYYGVKEIFHIRKVWCIDSVSWGKVGFFLQSITFALSAAWYAHHHRADVVYSRDILSLTLAPLGCRIFELHSATRMPLRFFDYLVVISNGLKKYALSRDVEENRISVIHDAATLVALTAKNTIRLHFQIPNDQILIAYVGKFKTMGVEKGVREIITAVGTISRSAHVGLVIVGVDNEECDEVKEIALDAGISKDSIFIIKHVPSEVARMYMRAADILVMNYPRLIHYAKYMSPLKLFEYLASGNAIATSDLPSVREILTTETAAFFPPDNVAALTETLTHLVSDPEYRERLGRQARKLAESHTYEHRAEAIERVLAQCSA